MKKIIAFIIVSLSLFASDLYVGVGIGSQSNNNENNFKSIKAFNIEWNFYKHFKQSDVGLGCIVENNLQANNNPYSLFAAYGIYRFINNSVQSRPFLSLKAGYFPLAVTGDLFGILYSSAGVGYNFKNKFEIELSYRVLFGADTSYPYAYDEDFSEPIANEDYNYDNTYDSGIYNSQLLTFTLRKNFH